MVSKTTQHISEVKTFSIFMLIVSLFFSIDSFSQTITDVFPIRVTSGSEITVLGTGFTAPTFDVNDITIDGVAIDASSIIVISDTELKFSISDTFSYQTIPDPADALDRVLTIDGVTITGANAAKRISYISPTLKDYQANSEFKVDEIFTSWDYNGEGYYRSEWFSNSIDGTYPNTSHDLLAFTIDGVTYSTGANDALLDADNDGVFDVSGIPYITQNYQAYSTNGVAGFPNRSNFLLMGDGIDGAIGTSVLNAQINATAYDVIIDGLNGLDLGTGIANFNKEVSVRFFSGNGVFGAVNDDTPDLLITQIAQPNGNNTDIYYYADIDGNIIGRPVRLRFSNSGILFKWYLDIYSLNTSVPFEVSYPTNAPLSGNQNRPFRMVGLKLSDFVIDDDDTGPNWIGDINNINQLAGGSADMAFLAYNKAAFDIKSPLIDRFPLARNICRVPSDENSIIKFSASGFVENPSDPDITEQSELDKEEIFYQWYKDFQAIGPRGPLEDTYQLLGPITTNELGNYRVRVENGYGAVDLRVTLSEGGTPTFWNNTTKVWELPPAYTDAEITVPDDERNLIFSENYNEDVDLVGCDCRVPRTKFVTIRADRTLTLYSDIIVEGQLAPVDLDGNPLPLPPIPAGDITFENNASLVQTKDVSVNENSGPIKTIRNAVVTNPQDYMYWSSPVADFNIANIEGDLTYQWGVNAPSGTPGAIGNWVAASGAMAPGQGYIKRAISTTNFDTEFDGVPNNGLIVVPAFKSTVPMPDEDRDWNFVGNPYPSALDASTFLATNTSLEGNVQIWTHGSGIQNNPSNDPFYDDFQFNYDDEYLTYNLTGGAELGFSFDGNIASGQAFFVQALNTAPDTFNVIFNNTMRSDSYANDAFFRSANPDGVAGDGAIEKQLIWLGLVNEANVATTTLLGYVDGATDDLDRLYDARKTGTKMKIYSVLDDEDLIIQGRAYPFDQNDTVALGVDILEDGIYKIAVGEVQGSVFENETQGIYLEDTYLNVIHSLRASPYSFAGIAGTTKDRFILRYSEDQQLSVADQNSLETFIYIKEERLYVKASDNIKSIVLYDVTGKQVVTYKLGANVSRSFNIQFQYPKGAYIGVINLDNNVAIAKKLIN